MSFISIRKLFRKKPVEHRQETAAIIFSKWGDENSLLCKCWYNTNKPGFVTEKVGMFGDIVEEKKCKNYVSNAGK